MFMSSCLKLCSFEHCKLRTLPSLKLSIYYQNDWRTRKYFLLKVPLYYELLVCKKKGAVRKEVGYFQILKKRDAVPEIRLEREEFWKKKKLIFKGGRFAQFVFKLIPNRPSFTVSLNFFFSGSNPVTMKKFFLQI